MKLSCITFVVCFNCKVFRNEFRKYVYSIYSVYTYVYLYLHVMFLNSFRNRFCEACPKRPGMPFPHYRFLPLYFSLCSCTRYCRWLCWLWLIGIQHLVRHSAVAVSALLVGPSYCLFSGSKLGRLWVYVLGTYLVFIKYFIIMKTNVFFISVFVLSNKPFCYTF